MCTRGGLQAYRQIIVLVICGLVFGNAQKYSGGNLLPVTRTFLQTFVQEDYVFVWHLCVSSTITCYRGRVIAVLHAEKRSDHIFLHR